MRKLLVFAFLVLACWAVNATGKAEAAKPIELTFLHTPAGAPKDGVARGYKGIYTSDDFFGAIAERFKATNPGVVVKDMVVDLSTGSTMTMDAMLAAGNAPDLYLDAALRASKYVDPAYALNLKSYVKDLDDFLPAEIAKVSRGGGVYALPYGIWATGMCVNMDIMADIGYQVPDNWTIAQFDEMAAKAKAKGYYATYLFAQNQSSNQWWMWWFYAFGAQEFAGGDYTRTRINTPQAVAALKYMKSLIDRGYVRKDAAAVSDGEVLDDFAIGKVAAATMQTGHTGVVAAAAKAGKLKKEFAYKFVNFPHADGVAGTPAASGASIVVVKASKDEARNKAAASLAQYVCDMETQRWAAYVGLGYPTRKSMVDMTPFSANDQKVLDVVGKYGTMDLGIASPKFPAVRASMFPLLQQFYQGKMTAEALLTQYEKTVNDIMAGK